MAKARTKVHKYGLFSWKAGGRPFDSWLTLFSDRADLDKHLDTAINSEHDSFYVLEHHPLVIPVSKEVAYNVVQVGRLDPEEGPQFDVPPAGGPPLG